MTYSIHETAINSQVILTRVLSDTELKNRDDHRHHAIDALVIALTTRSAIKQLSSASELSYREKGRTRGFHRHLQIPWDTVLEEAQEIAQHMIISRRVPRKVRGRLHEDTNYGPPQTSEKGRVCHAVRKRLTEMFKEKDIESIVDPVVRECVKSHFEKNGRDSKKAFSDPEYHPKTPDGTPIHKVRTIKVINAFPVGEGNATRFVSTDTNHHMEVIEERDNKGEVKWKGVLVSLLEAVRRKENGLSVVQYDHGEGKRLVFTIAKGDTFKIVEDGTEKFCVAISISENDIEMRGIFDARKSTDIRKEGGRIRGNMEKYRQRELQKFHINPIGEAYPSHD